MPYAAAPEQEARNEKEQGQKRQKDIKHTGALIQNIEQGIILHKGIGDDKRRNHQNLFPV